MSTALRQYVVSLSPTQAGAPVFPNILPAAGPAGDAAQPDDDGSRPAERVFAPGQRRDRAAVRRAHDDQRRLSVPERAATVDVGQPERADVRGVRQQQRLPAESRHTPTTASTRRSATRRTTACTSRSSQRTQRVGPISRVVHAVEGDEQRRRGVLQLADRPDRHLERLGTLRQRPAASPGRQRHRRRSGGFQFGGMVQAYSAPPFNITSGVTTVQGTAGRPIVDGEFIARNAGEGTAVLQPQRARQLHVPLRRPLAVRGARRRLQPHRSRQRRHAQHELRAGRISDQSVCRPSTRSPPSASRARSSSASD